MGAPFSLIWSPSSWKATLYIRFNYYLYSMLSHRYVCAFVGRINVIYFCCSGVKSVCLVSELTLVSVRASISLRKKGMTGSSVPWLKITCMPLKYRKSTYIPCLHTWISNLHFAASWRHSDSQMSIPERIHSDAARSGKFTVTYKPQNTGQ